MDERISQVNDPQLDGELWNAWVQKNAARDKARLARMKKVVGAIVIVGLLVVLVWRFAL